MKFNNRKTAGNLLASILDEYKNNKSVVVLGIPHGGVVVAKRVSEVLGVPFDIVVSRKIRSNKNSEYVVGVVTETGEKLFDQDTITKQKITQEELDKETKKQEENAKLRLKQYRDVHTAIDTKDKIIIIIDDGIATGWAMHGAILSVKHKNPKKIIIAVPVAPREKIEQFKKQVEKVYSAHVPLFFTSVDQYYLHYPPISEDKVIDILSDF